MRMSSYWPEDGQYRAVCELGCGPAPTPSPSLEEAQRMAVWHVYDDHPETWRRIIGNRPPKDPRPQP